MRLIDADALLAKMRRTNRYFTVKFDIEEAPTIEAEPVIHSRWVEDRDGDEYCENCSRYMPSREVTGDPSAINYCPNCGAKMDEEDNDAAEK